MADTTGNPWVAQHLGYEMESTGGGYTRREARKRVLWEYEGAPAPVACECGGKAFYRATVGTLMCPDCRNMYHADGTLRVRRAPGRTVL